MTDDGPGIPQASLDHIFELFYRDPDSARTVAGSGIGLFVCASLVEAMGGRIWARRPAGGGSEFGFTLRALEPDAADAGIPRDDDAGQAVGPATELAGSSDDAASGPAPSAAPALSEDQRQPDEADDGARQHESTAPDTRREQRQRDDRLDERQRIVDRAGRELHGHDRDQADRRNVDPVEERPRADRATQPVEERDAQADGR